MGPGKRQNNSVMAIPREDLLNGMGNDSRRLAIAATASLICHLLFFSVLLFMQTHSVNRHPMESFIRVDLVSLPAPKTPAKSSEPEPVATKKPSPPPPKTETVSTQPQRKSSHTPAKPKKKVSLKKKTFKPENVKKNALEKIEEKVDTTTTERIAEAIDRLKTKVAEEEIREQAKPDAKTALPAESVPDGGQDAGGRRAQIIDIYHAEIAYQIQKNWAFPDQFVEGNSDQVAALVFKVMPNGEIRDIFFTDHSGNIRLDESAKRAILKANPLPPYPPGISEPYIQLGVRFNSRGLKK